MQARPSARFVLGDREIDLAEGTIRTPDGVVPLTRNEVGLLGVLYQHLGAVVSRDLLMHDGLGYRAQIATRAVDQAIWRLRRKLEVDPQAPRFLRSETHEGYSLTHAGTGVVGPGPARENVATCSLPGGGQPSTRPFFGRSREQALLASAVRMSRLVTVCGPPGVGKSRLVTELLGAMPSPAVVVAVATARDGYNVEVALAGALGVAGATDVATILAARGPLVVVLDGVDAVMEAVGALVPQWLGRDATQASFVVTCRGPLGVDGERVVRLGSLPVEDGVQLFVDRATRADAAFRADEGAIAKLVAALDGLPLAIELAARRASMGLHVLLEGLPGVMSATVAQLSPDHRAALEAWAVFEGPFGLDDLGAVDVRPPHVLLDDLQALVEQGFVQVLAPGGRYALLGVFRELARRGCASGTHQARHAAHFARLGDPAWLETIQSVAAARRRLRDASPDLAAVVAGTGLDEHRAACGLALVWRMVREGPTAKGLELARSLRSVPCAPRVRAGLAVGEARLCYQIGAADRGIGVLRDVLAGPVDPADEAIVRCVLAMLLRLSGDPGRATDEIERASACAVDERSRVAVLQTSALYCETLEQGEERLVEAARILAGLRDHVAEGTVWSLLGHIAEVQGAFVKSARALQRALDVFGEDELAARQRALTVMSAVRLSRVRGQIEAASRLLEDAELLLEQWGTVDTLASVRIERARLLPQEHDEEAITRLETEIAGVTGNDRLLAEAITGLGERCFRRGDLALAREVVEEGLSEACRGRAQAQEAELCSLLAAIAVAEGQLDEAVSLLARAETMEPGGPVRVQVRLVGVLVAVAAGDVEGARRRLEEAAILARPYGLADTAALAWWTRRAEAAVGQATGRVRPVRRATVSST